MYVTVIATDRRDALARDRTLLNRWKLHADERLAEQIKMRVGNLPFKLLCYHWHQILRCVSTRDQRTMRCTEDAYIAGFENLGLSPRLGERGRSSYSTCVWLHRIDCLRPILPKLQAIRFWIATIIYEHVASPHDTIP